MHGGPGGSGLSRKAILYQIHRFDPGTPAAETMEALHDVVKAGDVRVLLGWRRSGHIPDLPQILSVRGLRDAAEPLLQRLQQTGQVGGNGEVVQSGCGEEARVGDVAQGAEQRRPEAPGVKEADGLGVESELAPGPHLEDLFQGAETAGQRHEGVGTLGHERLALVHRVAQDQLRHPVVRPLPFDHAARHDPDDLAARPQRAVRQHAHQAPAATAVDETDSLPGQLGAHAGGHCGVRRVVSVGRGEKDGEAAHEDLRNGWGRPFGLPRALRR